MAGVGMWSGCPAPGEGAAAEQGYRRSEPIVAALDRYRRDHGTYPNALTELNVPPDQLRPPVDAHPWEYHRVGNSYVLTFQYAGPGMNRCKYSPETGWNCSGYF